MLVAFFLEAGALLVVLPWSGVWERNFFIERSAWIASVATSPYIRGAVSGIGVLNVIAGLAELWPLLSLRARHDVPFADEADTQARP